MSAGDRLPTTDGVDLFIRTAGAAAEGGEGGDGAEGGWPMQSVEETILEVAQEYFNSAMSMTGDGVEAAEQTVAILLDVRPDSTCCHT